MREMYPANLEIPSVTPEMPVMSQLGYSPKQAVGFNRPGYAVGMRGMSYEQAKNNDDLALAQDIVNTLAGKR